MKIPLVRPALHEDAIAAANEVMRSGWIGMGPRVAAFEKAFAEYLGLPESFAAVAVNTCTSALHIALHLLALEPGSEVITTPNTFVATNQAILWANLKPVFADVEPDTGNLDARAVAEKITGRTRAVMVVHFAGMPCDMEALTSLARRHGLVIIEDCAHACGAAYRGTRAGASGNLSAFSFGPPKALTTVDGGMLIVPASLAEKARAFRIMGMNADIFRRLNQEKGGGRPSWDYEVPAPGCRYHMSDVAAAIGIAHLARLERDNARRAAIASHYDRLLAGIPGIRVPATRPQRQSAHYLYAILAEDRDRLAAALLAKGITTSVYYKPNYHHGVFAGEALPGAEAFYRKSLALPMFPQLTDEQVETVAAAIREGW